MNNLSIDDLLNKAFTLASFILGDRRTAIRIVEEAMARVNVSMAAQGKRLYYKPLAMSLPRNEKADRYRNKVLFSEMHLVQRLIYIASEPFEVEKERSMVAGDAADRQLLIHFIKHLIRITTRRNSFYVTLGISRLLYNYSTAETMDAYNAVIQDPGRVKDDYYYRSRKGVLMQELKKRFGRLIEARRGPHGEERFHASKHQSRFMDLVQECLTFFTPWETFCLVPAGVNPIMDGIAGLTSRGPQDEDKVEVDRIHAVLHPDCHERLIKSLGLESPERRLDVPHFFLSINGNGGEGTGDERKSNSNLSSNELHEIKDHLDDQSARRKRALVGQLRVLIDGHERARLTSSRLSRARVALEDDPELLEVRTMVDGSDLVLATHLFNYRDEASEAPDAVASIVLEGGQEVAIKLSRDEVGNGTVLDVSYRETSLARVVSEYARRVGAALFGQSGDGSHGRRIPLPVYGLALLVIVLGAIGVAQFLKTRSGPAKPAETIVGNQQGGADRSGETASARDSGNTTSVPAESPAAPTENGSDRNLVAKNNEQTGRRETTARGFPGSDTTRGISNSPNSLRLSEVRTVYVEVSGDDAVVKGVREKVITSLGSGQRFTVSNSKEAADALLRVTITNTGARSNSQGGASLNAILINGKGETIWSGAGKSSDRSNIGSIESAAAGIVERLLSEAGSLDRRR